MDLSNTWRISTDINPVWKSILHNLDCAKSYGKWSQPGAWTDLDLMEIDIGSFSYSTYHPTGTDSNEKRAHRLEMNRAHFAMWSILSAPLIVGMDLRIVDPDIVTLVTNEMAVGVNQKYLDHGGDVITEFDITDSFRAQYAKEMVGNNNQTEMFYKPLPAEFGTAAVLLLNRDERQNYSMSVELNQFPFQKNHNDPLQCTVVDIWRKTSTKATKVTANLLAMTGKFLLLNDCEQIVR